MANPVAAPALDFLDAPASSGCCCSAGDMTCLKLAAIPSKQENRSNLATRVKTNFSNN